MKRYIYLVFIGLATFIFASCEGPAGPPGMNGVDGQDGEAGTAACLECHGEAQDLIRFQFNSSAHNVGAIAVDYAGGRASCAPCHSHELYVEWAETGAVAEDVTNPSAWQCQTCHSIHATFEPGDLAFRAGDPVTLYDGTTVDGENNNTCMNCHQARRDAASYDSETTAQQYTRKFTGDDIAVYTNAAVGPGGSATLNGTMDTLTVVFDVPTTHVYINSTHAGPHHGPQADIWAGVNAAGTVTGGAFSQHDGGCVTCHMGEASGHSFIPKEENCVACHTSKESAMNAIQDRLEDIAHELEAIHAIHIDEAWESGESLFGAAHPVYASITREQFQAWWNFTFIMEDRSLSAHNPTFVKNMLDQCETALGL